MTFFAHFHTGSVAFKLGKILVSKCTRTIALFLGWCQCGCRNVIQAVRDRKEVSYISQEFCDNFCMLRKVCLNLPSSGQNGHYIKRTLCTLKPWYIFISNPRNHDLKLDFLCVRGILNWLVCRASEQTYVSILHP